MQRDGGTSMASTDSSAGEPNGRAGDTVVYQTNPGWTNWPIHLTFGLLVLVAGVFSENENIGLLLVLFALVIFGYVYLARNNSTFVVTDSRVRKEWGMVRRQTKDVVIDEITSTSIEQSWLNRLLGDGDVRIQSGSMGSSLTLNHVPDPERFVDLVRNHKG